jgi:hypothetical protein
MSRKVGILCRNELDLLREPSIHGLHIALVFVRLSELERKIQLSERMINASSSGTSDGNEIRFAESARLIVQ